MSGKKPTPELMAKFDCAYWTYLHKIRLQTGVFQFQGHEYLVDSLQSKNQIEYVMKATQGGYTETEVLRTLHGCINGLTPQGVLYLFPTTDDVQDFSKTRFNSLIMNNPEAIGKFVKAGGQGTDSAQLKRIGNSFLYFRGAVLGKNAGDSSEAKESSKLRRIPVDAVKFDEWDLMDAEVRKKAVGRMGHSLIKEERFLSNPTIPMVGIDALFQTSTQHHWFRLCDCKAGDLRAWTCAELEFPDCVKLGKDGKGYIACKYCGKPLGVYPAEWQPLYKDASVVGRRWSQLTSIYNDPYEILMEFNEPRDGNLADVYRLRLGLPYVSKDDQLTKADVYKCCGGDIMATSDSGPCAMGVDVGKTFHVTIGTRSHKKKYEILRVARVTSWGELHDLARKYNVRSAVIDILPYEDSAREFQKSEPYSIYLCRYNENTVNDAKYDKNTGIVTVGRTQIFDSTHRLFSEDKVVLPRRCPEIEEFAKQVCNAYRIEEKNKRTGLVVHRYRGENEHYRNSLNYFKLAADPKRLAAKKSRLSQYRADGGETADNNYKRSKF